MQLESTPVVGIALALASAAALSVGNLLQARGVHDLDTRSGTAPVASPARQLLHSHAWLIGALLLGVAILLQMGSLTFAPLIVVQPIGVSALVFTVLFTAIARRKAPTRQVVRAIAVSVVGVAAFVTVAAVVSTQSTITSDQLIAVLIVLGSMLVLTATVMYLGRHRPTPPLMWVLLGAIFSAFVATLGKTVILRVQTALRTHSFAFDLANTLTIVCILGIGVAAALSIYFVQRAHVDNRPDVVVAGLTVIDPTVAVILGITILGEAAHAPLWSVFAFIAAGAVAVSGVVMLSRAHDHASTGVTR